MVALEFEAKGFDDEVVVFALGKAGDRDGADDASARDVDGKAASVSGVVGVGKVVAVGEGAVGLFECQADSVGAAVEAGYDVDLALDPTLIIWRCAGERGVEELLVWLAEAADVDDDGLVASDGEFADTEAESPGGVVVEAGEQEFGFLAGDLDQVFGGRHWATP